ncbi:hypothetical protein NPIL_304881 [Nephila pilipes]|uniref:Uncharacterized protein n=1 Tax=Nephila pilipes TaxID=299642 RepID=A0A8X6PSI8_NEPPI|nr:hypothetical protein NPIL_304881 [Nephila pilipes]
MRNWFGRWGAERLVGKCPWGLKQTGRGRIGRGFEDPAIFFITLKCMDAYGSPFVTGGLLPSTMWDVNPLTSIPQLCVCPPSNFSNLYHSVFKIYY